MLMMRAAAGADSQPTRTRKFFMPLCLARGVTSLSQMARPLLLLEVMVLLILFPVFYLVFAVTVIALFSAVVLGVVDRQAARFERAYRTVDARIEAARAA